MCIRDSVIGPRDSGRQRSDADRQGRAARSVYGSSQGFRRRHAAGASSRRRTPHARSQRRGASTAGVIPRFPVYLFDIDGTLLDSAPDICGAIQQVLDGKQCRPVTFEYLKRFIGQHLNAPFGELFPDYTREQMDELFQQYRTFYHARRNANTRVYPGVAEALRALGGRKSTASTKGTPFSRVVLEQFGLLPYFCLLYTSRCV